MPASSSIPIICLEGKRLTPPSRASKPGVLEGGNVQLIRRDYEIHVANGWSKTEYFDWYEDVCRELEKAEIAAAGGNSKKTAPSISLQVPRAAKPQDTLV